MDAKKLDNIISTVEQAVEQLKGNDASKDSITTFEELFRPFANGGKELLTDGKILKIGVVGQVKAGKSSFLNSVMFNGDDILPKASTPMTAGLTILKYAENKEEQKFEVSYYTEKEWKVFEDSNRSYEKIADEVQKEMQGESKTLIEKAIKGRTSQPMQAAHELVTSCNTAARRKIQQDGKDQKESVSFSDIKDLQNILEKYVGANGDFTAVVKDLTIYLSDERLKDVMIVDTPGVNDPVVSRETRTQEFLASCHGVFFLSSSSRFLDAQDINFMNNRIAEQGIGTILLLASKYDSVLQDLGFQYKGKPQEGDLDFADDVAQRSLKGIFESKKREINSNVEKIKLDTTSGIGFSIAHKDKSALDSVELNVLEQMQKFYPDAFVRNDYQETFDMLSNISTIRDEYLEKDFKEKKNEIITQKINDFFANNVKELKETAETLKNDLQKHLQKIKESTVEQIKKQKAELKTVFSQTESGLKNVIGKFQNSLNVKIKELHNIATPSIDVKLADTEFELVCERDWAIFGHKTVTRYAKYLNVIGTNENIKNIVIPYCDQWEKGWADNFAKQQQALFDEYAQIIEQFSLSTSNQEFEEDVKQIMEGVLDEIEINKTLGLREVCEDFVADATDYIESCYDVSAYRNEYYDYKDDQLQGLLDKDVRKEISSIKSGLRNRILALPEKIRSTATKEAKEANSKLEGIKNSIASKLQAGSEQYFQKFEEEIKNIEKVIPMYEEAIAQVETIINALK